MTRVTVILATLFAALILLFPRTAAAQNLTVAGDVGLGTGIEGGDSGTDGTRFRRARTRIYAGGEARTDEDMAQGFGVRAFVEIEPHTAFGAELRYSRWLGSKFEVFGGLTTVLTPHLLLGVAGGADFFVPIGKTGANVFFEPQVAALPVGTDLPTDSPLVWLLFSVGVRADLVKPEPAK